MTISRIKKYPIVLYLGLTDRVIWEVYYSSVEYASDVKGENSSTPRKSVLDQLGPIKTIEEPLGCLLTIPIADYLDKYIW